MKSAHRWYETYGNITIVLEKGAIFPHSLQVQVAHNLLETVNGYCRRKMPEDVLKSLGAFIVMSLHKSKQRRRWYDAVPQAHQAWIRIRSLPAETMLELDGLLEEQAAYVNDMHAYFFEQQRLLKEAQPIVSVPERMPASQSVIKDSRIQPNRRVSNG